MNYNIILYYVRLCSSVPTPGVHTSALLHMYAPLPSMLLYYNVLLLGLLYHHYLFTPARSDEGFQKISKVISSQIRLCLDITSIEGNGWKCNASSTSLEWGVCFSIALTALLFSSSGISFFPVGSLNIRDIGSRGAGNLGNSSYVRS